LRPGFPCHLMRFAGVTPRLVAKVCAAGTGARKQGAAAGGRQSPSMRACRVRSDPCLSALAEHVRAGCGARAQVLRRDARSRTQLDRGMPGPARVPEKAARERDHVCLAFGDDSLGLSGFGDQADCEGYYNRLLADELSAMYL